MAEPSQQDARGESVAAAAAHLHAAARSLIAATRAFLDAAEALVETPGIFPASSVASPDLNEEGQ